MGVSKYKKALLNICRFSVPEVSFSVNAKPYDCILDVTTCRSSRDCPGNFRICMNGQCCRPTREPTTCPPSFRGSPCPAPSRVCEPGYTCREGTCCREQTDICPRGMSYAGPCFSGGFCLRDYQCFDGNCCKNDN